MSNSVNKVILIGNLGSDPENKVTTHGTSMSTVSLATNKSWQDKQSGDLKTQTEWHRVVFFNRLSEIVGQYLRKGSKIYVEGSLRTRKWQDTNGVDRYTTEIIASEMHMLDKRQDSIPGHESNQTGKTLSTPTNFGSSLTATPSMLDEPAPTAVPAYDDDVPF